MRERRKYLTHLALAFLLASCGGGGNGGISGTGIVYGPITGFGSIIVNGKEFDVTNAVITINRNPALESDLRLGMIVTVRGDLDDVDTHGSASSVDAQSTVRGSVTSIDVPAREILVLGQLVRVNAATVFEGTTLDALAVGDNVEVHGLPDSGDAILATRVELEEDTEAFEIEGRIENLDPVAETFFIHSLQVDYSGADVEDAPAGGLENGLLVEAESSQPPAGNLLVAEKVEVRSTSVGGEEGEEISVEGLITSVLAANRFTVNRGQVVRVARSTEFEGGDASDLVVDTRVEVEGTLDASSEIVAKKIELKREE